MAVVITEGAQIDYAAGDDGNLNLKDTAQLTTDKAIILSQDFGASPTETHCTVITASGTTLTAGTTANVSSTDDSDTLSSHSISKLSTTKAIVCYLNQTPATDEGTAVAMTISGTTITPGTPQKIIAGSNWFNVTAMDYLTDDKVFMLYNRMSAGSVRARVLDVSGTTITEAASVEFGTGHASGLSVAAITSTSAIGLFRNGGDINAAYFTVSGSTTTHVNSVVVESPGTMGAGGYRRNIYAISATKAVCVYQDGNGAGNKIRACVLEITGGNVAAGSIITVVTTGSVSSGIITKLTSTQVVFLYNNTVETATISGTTLTMDGNGVSVSNVTQRSLSPLDTDKVMLARSSSNAGKVTALSITADAYAYRHSSGGLPGAII